MVSWPWNVVTTVVMGRRRMGILLSPRLRRRLMGRLVRRMVRRLMRSPIGGLVRTLVLMMVAVLGTVWMSGLSFFKLFLVIVEPPVPVRLIVRRML